MSKAIGSAQGFLRWVTREKGPEWYKDKDIIKYYGISQLSNLYPQYFPKEDNEILRYQEKKELNNIMTQDLAGKTDSNENILKYPTPFDDYFTAEVSEKLAYEEVLNIFGLHESFDSSKVKLNIDRVLLEVDGIFNKESTRKERTYREVLNAVIMGHKLEQYLIDNNYFIDDYRPYMDVLSPSKCTVDCKVTSNYNESTIDFLAKKMLIKNSYNNSIKTEFMVIYSNNDGIYKYESTVRFF